MTEDEILSKVRELASHPRRVTMAAGWPGYSDPAPLFKPASDRTLADAKKRFGFAIPNLLARLWTEVANEGIGPGYGIDGLKGGMTDEGVYLPLPDLFLAWRDDQPWIDLVGYESSRRTFPICDWGCGTFSAIDSSTPDGNLLLFADGLNLIDQKVPLPVGSKIGRSKGWRRRLRASDQTPVVLTHTDAPRQQMAYMRQPDKPTYAVAASKWRSVVQISVSLASSALAK